MKKIGVSILGGTGFGAGELLRILASHPEVEVASVVSNSAVGQEIHSAHPHLRSIYNKTFAATLDQDLLSRYEKNIIISAIPHGLSGDEIQKLSNHYSGTLFIDLSGDLRLQDEAEHSRFYPHSTFHKELRTKAAYGLTELFAERIKKAEVISNPGCLATAAIIALAPFAGCPVKPEIILNLATGSSGAGKDPKSSTHHPVRHANFFAYKPLAHQHLPEVTQSLNDIGLKTDLSFVPHSLPVSRGILCTAYLTSVQPVNQEMILDRVKAFYGRAPFVRICESAELENVVGSNFCDISVTVQNHTIVVITAIDNLIKGMVGQAIQNMNIVLGLPETTGLWFGGLRPI